MNIAAQTIPAVDVTFKFLPPEYANALRGLGIKARRPLDGPSQGLHRSRRHGSSVEFAEYREYSPGDPVHLVDWAVYARSDRYVIRQYEEETSLRACILLDISRSMDFKSRGLYSKIDYARYLAAGLMYLLVEQRDPVGLITFDDAIRDQFEPAGSFEGMRPILEHFETIVPARESRIEQALHDAALRLTGKTLVIIVSDLMEPPEHVLRGLRHLTHDGHDVTVLHTIDRAERHLDIEGLAEIRDLETGRKLEIQADEFRDIYESEVARYLDEIRRGCLEARALYHEIDTAETLEVALQKRATRQR